MLPMSEDEQQKWDREYFLCSGKIWVITNMKYNSGKSMSAVTCAKTSDIRRSCATDLESTGTERPTWGEAQQAYQPASTEPMWQISLKELTVQSQLVDRRTLSAEIVPNFKFRDEFGNHKKFWKGLCVCRIIHMRISVNASAGLEKTTTGRVRQSKSNIWLPTVWHTENLISDKQKKRWRRVQCLISLGRWRR